MANRRTGHIGVSVAYIIRGIQDGSVKPDTIERDGEPVLSRSEALGYLRQVKEQGITILSGCPTPRPDGSCPGHSQEAT